MVCWKVSDVTCVIEVFVLLLWLLVFFDVSIAAEHTIALVVTIGVHLFAVLALWLHLPAKEIWVDLLVWINAILLIFIGLLHLPIHFIHLLVLHLGVWILHLVWLLLRLVLVVILFWVHVVSYLKIIFLKI